MNIRIKTEQGTFYLELPCREEKIAGFCKTVGLANTTKTEVTVESVYLDDRASGWALNSYNHVFKLCIEIV